MKPDNNISKIAMKRLTVHFRNAPKVFVRVGKDVKQCIINTRTFPVKDEVNVQDALDLLRREGRVITKYYLSNVRGRG